VKEGQEETGTAFPFPAPAPGPGLPTVLTFRGLGLFDPQTPTRKPEVP
jgi:hypothetical protein